MSFDDQISDALGASLDPELNVEVSGTGDLPSCFPVADLARATVSAAAAEAGDLLGVSSVNLDRRLAQFWFDMTLRPQGWERPSIWDAIAGVYRTSDGWIRLHTNAPHHREAALSVLDCAADKASVAEVVSGWTATALETAIVEAKGAAAAMRDMAAWQAHPQGQAVSAEPLIAWEKRGDGAAPTALAGLKVLDLTRVLAGPVGTRFLAAYGARVLRIDPPSWNEPPVETEVTLGKACAGLDLRAAKDRQTFERLLSEADVLVHGYRPGALEGLGYGVEARERLSPGLIDVSLCAYGWTGPWRERRGFDSLVQMSCGIAAEGQARARTDGPKPLPVQALDHATGYLIAASVLRALRIRRETGESWAARLSLARTAALLMSGGAHDYVGAAMEPSEGDYPAMVEQTGWGPAQRVRFPVQMNGKEPDWKIPAGPVRSTPAEWPGEVG